MVKKADKLQVSVRVFELECSLETLQKRDRERELVTRGFRKPLGNKVIEKLYRTVAKNPWPGAEKLDTEALDLDGCVALIKKEMEG